MTEVGEHYFCNVVRFELEGNLRVALSVFRETFERVFRILFQLTISLLLRLSSVSRLVEIRVRRTGILPDCPFTENGVAVRGATGFVRICIKNGVIKTIFIYEILCDDGIILNIKNIRL